MHLTRGPIMHMTVSNQTSVWKQRIHPHDTVWTITRPRDRILDRGTHPIDGGDRFARSDQRMMASGGGVRACVRPRIDAAGCCTRFSNTDTSSMAAARRHASCNRDHVLSCRCAASSHHDDSMRASADGVHWPSRHNGCSGCNARSIGTSLCQL